MQFKLKNCNTRLLALGIDMNAIGSGNLLFSHLPPHESWEYDFTDDMLELAIPDGSTTPADMSKLGEVVT